VGGQDAGVDPANLDPRFVVDWRDGFWVATNFTSKDQKIPAASANIIVGGQQLAPGAATVWKEK